jgi:NitT/TauT family transport system ATP-binding protein
MAGSDRGQAAGAQLLSLQGVSKQFAGPDGAVLAVRNVSFALHAGEFVCLLGPSGSGKSTLLRIAGGLLTPDEGQVWFEGQLHREPHPDIGFVFQKTNLMPWRTVLENVLLPVEIKAGAVHAQDRKQATALLQLVGLEGFENAYPRQLSGGMAQRAVLARTLIESPQLLLMDEPFGSLDAMTRERMNLELLHVHSIHAATVLMVTHSIPEAIFLADRIIVLSQRPGKVVAELEVELPRPRSLEMMGEPEFGRQSSRVRSLINQGATQQSR